MIKKYVLSSLVALSLIAGGVVFAQSISGTQCIELKSTTLWYGSRDASTGGEVTLLQKALVQTGTLQVTPNGTFGPATLRAVRAFQSRFGIRVTGFAGEATRAKIKEVTCGVGVASSDASQVVKNVPTQVNGSVTVSPNAPQVTIPKTSQTPSKACTMEARMCPDGTVMPRNINNCEWLEWKCGDIGGVTNISWPTKLPATTTPTAGFTKVPPVIIEVPKNIPQNPISTVVPIQKVCTTEVRLCSDGKMMQRNMTTCEWIASSCATAKIITAPVVGGANPPDIPGVVTLPKDVINCTMQAKLCPNGEAMFRDDTCGWHPEKCGADTGSGGMQCTKNPVSGKVFCGVPEVSPSLQTY